MTAKTSAPGSGGPQVQDVYGLTPTQAGMLWASVESEELRRYHEQLVIEMTGDLDPDVMAEAWQAVVDRHDILRTGFHWEEIATPVQVVHRRAAVEVLTTRSTSDLSLEAILASDRERGFDLSAPSLMRLHLVETEHRHWRMVWSFSHLILDGWSLPLVLGDVMTAYEQLRRGKEPQVPHRPQFRDFVAWLARRDRSAALDFWADQLHGLDAPTPLGVQGGAARTDSADPGAPLIEREWVLEPDLAAAVADLCRRGRVTLGTVLYGAWALVLSRYSSRDDIVFGTTASGRPADLDGAGDMVGIFITTVPVRVRVDPDAPIADWLRSIQEDSAAATDAHHVPLPEIRARSAMPADQPLFESLLVLENYPAADVGGEEDLALGQVRAVERTEFPLVIVASPSPSPAIKVAVDPGRISAAAAERLLGHLRHALQGMARAPDGRLGGLDVIGAEEQDLLKRWGHGAEPPATPAVKAGLAQTVMAHGRKGSDALAVTGAAGDLTYGHLAQHATDLSRHLAPACFVGVCSERAPALAIGALAVATAGAVHVLLDPEWPDARLISVAAQTGLSAVVSSPAQTARLQSLFTDGRAVVIDALAPDGHIQDAALPRQEVIGPAGGVDDLAYVVMTSGSTGDPKAVTATKTGLLNLVSWHLQTYGLDAGQRCGVLAAPGFDASIWELWPALAAGATLCVPPDEVRADPEGLCEWLASTGIEVAFVPTPLTDAVLAAHGQWPLGGKLRFVLTGGDALVHGVSRGGGPQVVNHYGPSESTVVSTSFWLRADHAEPPPIGRPIQGTHTEVRDSVGRPCPIGVAGELWVGGLGLSAGYLGRPDLTAEQFADGWYRTGDMVRWSDEGVLQFIGREDDQVKVRGVRIELGEVEAALAAVPGVAQAAVARRGDRLVGWVTRSAEEPMDPSTIRRAVSERLPAPFVPAAIGVVHKFPMTPNGKINRDALEDPASAGEAGQPAHRPSSATEELIAAIWREVLDVDSVSPTDDFFSLGGHSLSATRVVSRLRSTFDVDVEVGAVFDHPSVRELAQHVDAASRESLSAPILAVPRDDELPLSFAQQRLWFLDQLEPGSPTHNTGAALVLEGRLDLEALQQAVDVVVSRHEALRTTFPERGGRPFQRVHDDMTVVIHYEDRQGASLDEIREATWDGVREPFGLDRDALVRVKVFELAPETHALLLYQHHIVSDGWSMSVLVSELSEAYTALHERRPAVLPDLPVQYADYAVWQREWLTGERLEGELSWWREHLAGASPVLDLPLDRPRTPLRSHEGASEQVQVDPQVAQALVALCGKRRVTLFMGLMSALAAFLGRVCRTEDVIVGTPVANRNRPELQNLTGFFVNTLALRTRLDGDPTFIEVLDRVRKASLGAYAHQDLPFEKLVEELAPDRDLRTSPLFQVMLDLADQSPAEWELADMTVRSLEASPELAPFDLTVEAAFDEAGLHLSLNYATALFDETTIRSLGESFATFLAEAVTRPEARVNTLPLVGDEALGELSTLGSGPPLPGERSSALERIRSSAESTPEATAIISDGESISFGDLMARAEDLSGQMVERRSTGNELVSIRLPKGSEVVASLLAAWRIGTSPLMLDPAWPEPRVAAAISEASSAPLEAGQFAYCICTSGSTGRPKVIGVTHDNLAATAAAWDNAYRDERLPRRFLSTSGVGFDVFIADVVKSLGTGATLVMCPEDAAIDPPLLAALIADERIDHLNLVPSTARALAAHLSSSGAVMEEVEIVIVGSEAWTGADVGALRDVFPRARIVGAYGVSEAAVDTAWFEATDRVVHARSVVPLGRPLAGVRLSVVGPGGHPVPRGVSGELVIGGPGVAPGYLGRADLTRARFNTDGVVPTYLTGDRVRWASGGDLEFLGRMDDQVQVRGQRVEPAEVEAVLAMHPDVADAAVALQQGALSAFIVAQPGTNPAAPELRAHVQAHLPLGMVPSRFFLVDSLPRGATGKLERHSLPAPDDVRRLGSDSARIEPRTGAEKEVAAIWEQVLGVEHIGVEDNFFDLGGHSMLATEVVAGIREHLGVELPLRRLFESPTVADIARLVEVRP